MQKPISKRRLTGALPPIHHLAIPSDAPKLAAHWSSHTFGRLPMHQAHAQAGSQYLSNAGVRSAERKVPSPFESQRTRKNSATTCRDCAINSKINCQIQTRTKLPLLLRSTRTWASASPEDFSSAWDCRRVLIGTSHLVLTHLYSLLRNDPSSLCRLTIIIMLRPPESAYFILTGFYYAHSDVSFARER